MSGRMTKREMTMYKAIYKYMKIGIVVFMVSVFIIIAITAIVNYFATETANAETTNIELQKKSQEKHCRYQDDGSGIMIIKEWNICLIKEGYLQWRKNYPERAKKIIAVTVSGGYGSYFMLIYETE